MLSALTLGQVASFEVATEGAASARHEGRFMASTRRSKKSDPFRATARMSGHGVSAGHDPLRASRVTPTRRRLALALAMSGVAAALGTPTAGADPSTPATAGPIPGGRPDGPQIVVDVLGPADPGFWNPAVPGTRVLTPIDSDRQVACLTRFVPVINCWTVNRFVLAPEHRPLVHVDVPVIGGPPMRVWVDLPRWGDGSTGEGSTRDLTLQVVIWWLSHPMPS